MSSYLKNTYESAGNDDQKQASNVINYPNGDVYEGGITNGKPEGKGTMTYQNGDVYEGGWNNGEQVRGKMTYQNGDVYEGGMTNGKPDGRGTMTYQNGDVYKGGWINGLKNGYGDITYQNGDNYFGQFKNDLIEGRGTMTYKNGDVNNAKIYEGNWIDGKFIYNGIITFIDGSKKKFINGKYIPDKPANLKSVTIKKQKNNVCWAHAVSRNFVRTLQILDVIKYKYNEEFYILFYTILTEYYGCDNSFNEIAMFYLFNYLKNNYKKNIFNLKTELNKIILNELFLNENDKQKFICDMKYLFDNNLLFIGHYDYIVKPNSSNKPSKAIKTMLYYRLQPYVGIHLNEYFVYVLEEAYSTISSTKKYNNNCIKSKIFSHAVNLRKWEFNRIEFKNSWGQYSSNKGNFSVSDLSYLICKKDNKYVNNITFTSLMFYYENLNREYKNRVNTQLCSYWKTFDNKLETEESEYYIGSYNNYGLFEGQGKMNYQNGEIYEGEWINGKKNGKGKMIFSNGYVYEGEWVNGLFEGQGKYIYPNGNVYEGEWKDDKPNGKGTMTYQNGLVYEGELINGLLEGQGKIILPNGGVYEGELINGNAEGQGKYIYPNGDVYEGAWVGAKKNGKGKMTNANGNIIFEGEWKDDEFVEKKNQSDKTDSVDNSLNYKKKYLKYKLKYLNLKK